MLVAYHNNLRARCLLSFMAVVLQVPAGLGLQWLLDNKAWNRRKRALIGLTVVAVPMVAAWIWEIVGLERREYDTTDRPPDTYAKLRQSQPTKAPDGLERSRIWVGVRAIHAPVDIMREWLL